MTTKQTFRRRFAAAALLAATGAGVAAGALTVAAPAGAANQSFVAISYSPETGSWGYGNQYSDLNSAVNRSLTECRNAGGSDCQFVAWAQDACAALAVSHTGYYGWWGSTLPAAESAAIQKNGGGYIEVSRCSW